MTSCVALENGAGDYSITNIKIFAGTEAWDLAVAVKNQNAKRIEKIAKENPDLLNFQAPFYRATLLIWAVGMEKYKSAEVLLKCGADPNIVADGTELYESQMEEALANNDLKWFFSEHPSPLQGTTALNIASGYSWIDTQAKKDPKYVKLLLEYGADPNLCYTVGMKYLFLPNGIRHVYGTESGTSPLMNSISCGIEKTRALVEAGADIDNKTESGNTAAIIALNAGGGPMLTEARRYAHYLIAEKKAAVTEPYFRGINYTMSGDDPNDEFYPVNLLRYWKCDLNSEDYKLKMEIVEEFARQGVDYWATEIPQKELESIKNMYPDTWKEYTKVY